MIFAVPSKLTPLIVLAVSNLFALEAIPLIVPVTLAKIVFAKIFPLASLATIVDAPFAEAAVVLAFATVPVVT